MTLRALGPDEIRVSLLEAGSDGRALYYNRKLAGRTVAQAVETLNGEGPGNFPNDGYGMAPCYVNGELVDIKSDRVLQAGDRLTLTDP